MTLRHVALALLCLGATPALAAGPTPSETQSTMMVPQTTVAPKPGLSFTLRGGVASNPEYFGSDENTTGADVGFKFNFLRLPGGREIGNPDPWADSGAVLAIATGFIVYGGIHRIAKAADIIIPVMAFGYIAMALLIILLNITGLPGVIWDIVANAFGFREAVAGGMGAAIAQGLRRGLFSNEAGLGSAPNVAATAYVKHPVSQGITQSFSVFIDTIIICSCTAFVILLGDVYVPGAEGVDGVALTQQSMVDHVGAWAQYFLTAAIFLFSFSSIMYNYYLGENALSFLTEKPMAVHILRVAIIGIVFLGAVAPGATVVFNFSDPMMGILAVVNLLALMMLFPIALRMINDFRSQLAAGVARPIFDPKKFPDLDTDPTAWPDAK